MKTKNPLFAYGIGNIVRVKIDGMECRGEVVDRYHDKDGKPVYDLYNAEEGYDDVWEGVPEADLSEIC